MPQEYVPGSIPPADAMRILDEPVSVTLSTTLTGNLAYELKRFATNTQRTPQSIVREAVKEWLEGHGSIIE